MADQSQSQTSSQTTPQPPEGATAVETENTEKDNLETTTSKDNTLPVNQGSREQTEPKNEPAPQTTSGSDSNEAQPEMINKGEAIEAQTGQTAASEKPIVVEENELATDQTTAERLAEEIETLSGEIQALEAKIDRLASSIQEEPPEQTKKEVAPAPKTSVEAQPEPKPAAPAATDATEAEMTNKPHPLSDIYAKVAEQRQHEEEGQSKPTTNLDEAEELSTFSGVGTIGEVLAIFGIGVLVIMLSSPLLKSFFPESLWAAVSAIGWPTSGATLFIGFILLLFAKGKNVLKIIVLLLFIVSALMYLGSSDNSSLLGPIGTALEGVFTFYR